MGFFKINGVELPYPAFGLKFEREQLVDSARNALGQVVAQKINRRLMKASGLQWKYLSASDWRKIQNEVDKFEGELYYWDNPTGSFKTRRVYWGNESAEVFKIDPSTGEILSYINCAVNIIDMGYED